MTDKEKQRTGNVIFVFLSIFVIPYWLDKLLEVFLPKESSISWNRWHFSHFVWEWLMRSLTGVFFAALVVIACGICYLCIGGLIKYIFVYIKTGKT